MATIKQLQDYRNKLLTKTEPLTWVRLKFSDGSALDVCSPLRAKLTVPDKPGDNGGSVTTLPDWGRDCLVKDEPVPQSFWVYLPVTRDENWALAKTHNAYPLTTAVADQAHLHQDVHGFTYAPWEGNRLQAGAREKDFWSYNFIGYGQILSNRKYQNLAGSKLVSGAHKLWIVHIRDVQNPGNPNFERINYGFYQKTGAGAGKYLSKSKWNTEQGPGYKHPETSFWDYSQLLQLMRNYMNPDKTPGNIYHALQDKELALWDTTWGKMSKQTLDDLGLTAEQGRWA